MLPVSGLVKWKPENLGTIWQKLISAARVCLIFMLDVMLVGLFQLKYWDDQQRENVPHLVFVIGQHGCLEGNVGVISEPS